AGGFELGMEGDAGYERIAERVAAVAPGRAGELVPYLATLLGVAAPDVADRLPAMAPQELRERVFGAVGEYLAALAASRPTVLVFEDLHWADPTSLELLEQLMALTDEAPLMLLALFRPHRQERSWRFHEAAQRDYPHRYTAIELAPLDEAGARQLVVNLLSVEGLSEAMRRQILARAEGNPFFVEEVIRALLDAGAIVRENAHWVATRELASVSVPSTLAGVLIARLDRLDDETRRVAQTAAVIGREFAFDILGRVHDGAGDTGGVERALRELQRRELVRERGRVPERVYLFKHVLTQEAAYDSLLLSRRRELHRRVAEALEAAYPERLEQLRPLLARHYALARDWARALAHAERAAAAAQAAHASREALMHYGEALTAAERGGAGAEVRQRLHRGRGQARDTLGDFEAARADYDAALALAREIGDRRAEWRALLDLGLLWASRDYAQTGEYFRRALALARALDDPAALAESLNRLGNWHLNVEEPQAAVERHREALALFEWLGDRPGQAETHDLLGLATSWLGDVPGALAHAERAVALFQELGDRRGLAAALPPLATRGGLYQQELPGSDPGTYAAALRDGERALALARELGWRAGEGYCLGFLAAARQWRGEYAPALTLAREALGLAEEIGHRQWTTSGHFGLGMLHLDLLALPAAREHLERALALGQETRSLYWVRVATGVLARACVAQGDLARAGVVVAAADPGGPVASMAHWLLRYGAAALTLARGEPEVALRLAGELARPIAPGAAPPNAIRVAWLRGEALAALGRAGEAEAALRTALEGASAQALPPLLWRLHAALARLFQAMGRRDEAEREAAAGRAIIEELAAGLPDLALRETFHQRAIAQLLRP
ncbi:MAG TPA: AAA family ATPase, partial [Vicinamibacteria bacterium]